MSLMSNFKKTGSFILKNNLKVAVGLTILALHQLYLFLDSSAERSETKLSMTPKFPQQPNQHPFPVKTSKHDIYKSPQIPMENLMKH